MLKKDTSKKYSVFISYKHSATGKKHAVALETALKSYAKPSLSRPPKIFRDEKHMVPDNDLPNLIRNGLEQSEYLIFIAEKGAAKSKWCCDELEYWCGTLNRKDKLILLHAADEISLDLTNNKVIWEKSDALPALLEKYIFSIPFYADVHQLQDPDELKISNPEYRSIVNIISSKLRGVSPEELSDEALKTYRNNIRLRNGAIGILLLMLFVSVILLFYIFQKQRESEKKYRAARNASLVFSVAKKDPTVAVRMADYNLKQHPQDPAAIAAFHEVISNPGYNFYKNSFNTLAPPIADNMVAFSPDGKSILVAREDNIAILRNLQGNILQIFRGHTGFIRTVLFSPDGKMILTGSDDKTAKLWDLKGNVLQTFQEENFIHSAAFSPDGKMILLSTGKSFKLLNIHGEVVMVFNGHTRNVLKVTFSPDGKYILSLGFDDKVKLWDIEGEEIESFYGREVASFSPDGKRILTVESRIVPGKSMHTFKLCDLQGNIINAFEVPYSLLETICFSPDGKTFLSGGHDNKIKLWDLKGNELKNFSGHFAYIKTAVFSPDGKYVLSGSYDNTVKLWDIKGNESQTLTGHNNQVGTVEFSPDGETFLTGGIGAKNCKAILWSIKGEKLQSFNVHSSSIFSAAFSPDEKLILTGGWDKTAKLWDLEGNILQSFAGHEFPVQQVAFSPDGRKVLTVTQRNIVKIWDLNGRELKSIEDYPSSISKVAFSPDGKKILTSNENNTLKIWDWEGNELQKLYGHEENVKYFSFSPDGKNIISGGKDGVVILWDLQGNMIRTFEAHANAITNLLFSPDGNSILTACFNGKFKLWDKMGNLITEFGGGINNYPSFVFSSDGKMILSKNSLEEVATLWDLEGNELQTYHTSSFVSSIAFSPDNKTVFIGNGDHSATLRLLPQQFLDQKVFDFPLDKIQDTGILLEPDDL